MRIDVRTLFVTDTAIALALCAVLLFYWTHRKTYDGFGWWILGSVAQAVGFIGLGFRGFIPDWVGILTTNAAFGLSAAFRFEGTMRFTARRRVSRWWYGVPVVMVALCSPVSPFHSSAPARALVSTVAIGLLSTLIGLQFLKPVPDERPAPYRVLGYLHLLFVALLLGRSILWLLNPGIGLLDPWLPHELFFLGLTLFEVVWAVSFTMLNGNRLEAELVKSQSELSRTVDELQQALREVSTLSGLLPICSSCRRVRDDEGYWNQLEVYLRQHTDLQLSHGLCPECAHRLYPDVFAPR